MEIMVRGQMDNYKRLSQAVSAWMRREQTAALAAEVIAAAKRLHRESRRNRLYVGLCNAEPASVADALGFAGAYNAHLLESESMEMERDCSAASAADLELARVFGAGAARNEFDAIDGRDVDPAGVTSCLEGWYGRASVLNSLGINPEDAESERASEMLAAAEEAAAEEWDRLIG